MVFPVQPPLPHTHVMMFVHLKVCIPVCKFVWKTANPGAACMWYVRWSRITCVAYVPMFLHGQTRSISAFYQVHKTSNGPCCQCCQCWAVTPLVGVGSEVSTKFAFACVAWFVYVCLFLIC